VSGGISALLPVAELPAITNSRSPCGGSRSTSTASTRASVGASVQRAAPKTSSDSDAPSASMTTPCPSLRTNPPRASCRASPNTNGRKPTPCTIPLTRKRRRSICHILVPRADPSLGQRIARQTGTRASRLPADLHAAQTILRRGGGSANVGLEATGERNALSGCSSGGCWLDVRRVVGVVCRCGGRAGGVGDVPEPVVAGAS
jgi:hypothetical protein